MTTLLDEVDPPCPRGCGRTMDDCHEAEDGNQCAGSELVQRLKAERDKAEVHANAIQEENDRLHKQVDDLRQGEDAARAIARRADIYKRFCQEGDDPKAAAVWESAANLAREYVTSGALDEPRPTVVCLCGSTRFSHAFREANLRETLAGRIVLSIGCDMRTDTELFADLEDAAITRIKVGLDELHKRKIDLADEILVLNVGGYVGSSTRSEIEYAEAHGKLIRWLEPVTA